MYLFVNTTRSGVGELALYNHTARLHEVFFEGDYRVTEDLLTQVDIFLKQHNLMYSDLEGVVVVTGPGPFTALRLTCTMITMLAYLYEIPIYGNSLANIDTDEKIMQAFRRVERGVSLTPVYDTDPTITQ